MMRAKMHLNASHPLNPKQSALLTNTNVFDPLRQRGPSDGRAVSGCGWVKEHLQSEVDEIILLKLL
jgi:hypothetical protein